MIFSPAEHKNNRDSVLMESIDRLFCFFFMRNPSSTKLCMDVKCFPDEKKSKSEKKRVNIDVDTVSPSLPHQCSQTERNDLLSLVTERKTG